jgi:hypothetical protein
MFKSARYDTEDKSIIRAVTDDGIAMFIPAIEANRHFVDLMEWQKGGGVIADHEPEPAAPAVFIARKTKILEVIDGLGQREGWLAAIAAAKQSTQDYWEFEPDIPSTNPKMQRVAASLGLDWVDIVTRASKL